MAKQGTLHYTRAVWRICYHRWFSKCVSQTSWFCFNTKPSFFPHSWKKCVWYLYLYSLGCNDMLLVYWSEMNQIVKGSSSLLTSTWSSKMTESTFRCVLLSPACKSLPLVSLMLKNWDGTKKILRRWLGQSQLTWASNSIWCHHLHANTDLTHKWVEYLQMCASNPDVMSLLTLLYTEQRDRCTCNNNQQNRLQIMMREIELGYGDGGGWLITYFSAETIRPDWRPSTGEQRKTLAKVISMEHCQQTT